jgi:hypothetical protein
MRSVATTVSTVDEELDRFVGQVIPIASWPNASVTVVEEQLSVPPADTRVTTPRASSNEYARLWPVHGATGAPSLARKN